MSNISAVTAVTTAVQSISNLILVTPQNTIGYQPQNQVGQPYNQPALLFNYEGENTSTFESDITDHYIEDNTAIQDQIALKPLIVTVQGYIGELNDIPPNSVFQAAFVIANKLTNISAYAPQLSVTALNAYNEAVFGYETALNAANSAISAVQSITGLLGGSTGESVIVNNQLSLQRNQTQQQQMYTQLFGYYSQRTLFTIQTPWAIFENMAIMSCKATQSADTRVISDFTITFKQLKFASVLTEASGLFNNTEFQGRLLNQGANVTNLGTSSLLSSPTANLSTSVSSLTK